MNHEQPDIESQQSAADAAATAGVNDEVERLRAEIEQVKADALRERADWRTSASALPVTSSRPASSPTRSCWAICSPCSTARMPA